MRIFILQMVRLRSYLLKAIGLVLLASILQSYACSAFCSINNASSCAEEQIVADCCHPEGSAQNSTEHSGDCQKEHFSYFHTIGQFHSKAPLALAKSCLPIDISFEAIDFNPFNNSTNKIVVFTSFRPPPPKDGVPVLISSFRI